MIRKSIGVVMVFMSVFFVFGCRKNGGQLGQFIISSDEDGVICSAKSTFNDTIFYENKFPDATIYYYTVLSRHQNEELKKSIENLKTEKSIPKFELRPGGATFIVESDKVLFYEGNYSIQSPNIKKILTLFRDLSPKMKTCKKVEDFWNIEDVIPPENPIE